MIATTINTLILAALLWCGVLLTIPELQRLARWLRRARRP